MTERPRIRCAIYTRKSSDEGLDQAFNSLDAQHEACAAYVASQRHEGWSLVPERFDDGGLSGGTLERPALQRLLAEVEAGRIGMIVVYKIDRLTRSLADFARLVERLEARGCSFVSVTQAFNTSTSMGRLTLNVLLSFAQFEREVTAERIRDKIAASKKKGLWMGGNLPLGYDSHPDPQRRELVVNPAEAETVRCLFTLYQRLGCLRRLTAEAARLELRSKCRPHRTGSGRGGGAFSRGQLYYLLTNPTYRGLIRHKTLLHPGQHPAIIDEDLWARVQETLQAAARRPRGRQVSSPAGTKDTADTMPPRSWLVGRLYDETGDRLTPSHTTRAGRRHRYYVSGRLISGGPDPAGWRLPAAPLETLVAGRLRQSLLEAAQAHQLLSQPQAGEAAAICARMTTALAALGPATPPEDLLDRVDLAPGRLRITLRRGALATMLGVAADALAAGCLIIDAPLQLRRRGVEVRLVSGTPRPDPDATLVRALARSHRWAVALRDGHSLAALAAAEGHAGSYLRTRLPLAFLAPDLQRRILDGTLPPGLSLERLLDAHLPLDWTEQRRRVEVLAAGSKASL